MANDSLNHADSEGALSQGCAGSDLGRVRLEVEHGYGRGWAEGGEGLIPEGTSASPSRALEELYLLCDGVCMVTVRTSCGSSEIVCVCVFTLTF